VVERTGREGGAGSLVLTKLETKKNRPKAAWSSGVVRGLTPFMPPLLYKVLEGAFIRIYPRLDYLA